MRVHSSAASVSWIPTESLQGALKGGVDLQVSHFDVSLPDRSGLPRGVHNLFEHEEFRFANLVSATAEFDDDGRVVSAAYDDDSRVVMGSTTVHIGRVGATFRALPMPTLQQEPEVGDGEVRFVQTAGGRTALPVPRPVTHPPFLRWQSPVVWTTLALTLRADGSHEVDLVAASAFPRHWVYDEAGGLRLRSNLAEQARWVKQSFGNRTPWTDREHRSLVAAAEQHLERELATDVVRDGARPAVRDLAEGERLTRQGDPGDELFFVLDGTVGVDVDGRAVAELGPGAVIGERALLDGAPRAATVTARSAVRVAVAGQADLDLDRLRTLSDATPHQDATADD